MAVTTKIEPISDFIEIVVRQDLTPAAQSKAFADFAREKLTEVQEKNRQALGRVPPHETAVDGRIGVPLESVRPNGTIVFEFELIDDVLLWIAETLLDRSPIQSGTYRKNHRLFADGVEISIGDLLAGRAIPAAAEYSFTNVVPYSRKIEIGKTKSGRAFVVQVPNRIYERTSADARRRFGNVSAINFTYRGFVGGNVIDPRGKNRRVGNVSGNRFPVITVTSRAS